MSKAGDRKETYVVTHGTAPDPDPDKVRATLEYWQHALAERVMADGAQVEQPIARIQIRPRRRLARRARASGENRNA